MPRYERFGDEYVEGSRSGQTFTDGNKRPGSWGLAIFKRKRKYAHVDSDSERVGKYPNTEPGSGLVPNTSAAFCEPEPESDISTSMQRMGIFDEDPITLADPYFPSGFVRSLHSFNYCHYFQSKDLVLVMFYDPRDPGSERFSYEFDKAAAVGTEHNKTFASVNCAIQNDLCCSLGVHIPYISLYSRGKHVTSVSDTEFVNTRVLLELMRDTPV